jgi:hypothetical protein
MATTQQAEESSLIAWFKDIMPGNWKEFSGDNASDLAKALVAQQEERWRSIFGELRANLGGRWNELVSSIETIILECEPASISNMGSAFVVERSIPLITRDVDAHARNRILNNQIIAVAYIALHCAKVIPSSQKDSLFGVLLSSAVAKLEFNALSARNPTQDEHITEVAAAAVKAHLEKSDAKLRSLDTYIHSLEETTQQQLETSLRITEGLRQKDQAREKLWEEEKIEFVESIRREALEAAEIKSSIELWNTKAKTHEIVFWLGSGIFVVALSATSVCMVKYGTPLVHSVANTFAGNQQYFGIALLLIPTLAIAWIFRFVAKITLENLALAQDARQRHTQILTYLRMLGDSNRSMTRDERILALAAIFRPFSGQGNDDIAPPTVADLVREAVQDATKPK